MHTLYRRVHFCELKKIILGEIMSFLVVAFIVIKNTIYGLSVLFTGNLTESVDVLDVLSLRFLMSFVVLFLLKSFKIVKINVGIKDIFSRKKGTKGAMELLLAGLFEPVLYMLFETLGISMTTAITAGVIISLSPIFSCICEGIVLKEKNTFMQKVFLVIGIIGVMYIAINTKTNDGKNTVSGIIFMFLAVISGQMFAVFSRKSSKQFKAFEVSYITCFLGTVAFNTVNVIRHIALGNLSDYFKPYFNIENLLGFAYLGILSTIVATAMNNYALSKASVSSLAAFGGVSTLVTIFAGVFLQNEKLYTYHIIGITLIVIRMVGVSYIDIKKQQNKGSKIKKSKKIK